jgi:hypothetical protein
MDLQPKSVAVGLGYHAPRFTGRWLSLVAESSIIFNRDDGHAASFFVTFGQAFKAAAIPPPLGP